VTPPLTRSEREVLRGLVHLAWADRHDEALARRNAARIVDWWLWGRYAGRARRREVDLERLLELLRRTDVGHHREEVADRAA
jgi:hypothetical protein